VIESLKTNHKVTRGWLGVQIQPVTPDIAESLGLENAKGAIISELTDGSPALKAGLKSGDTILKVDGIDIADARDLAKVISHVAPGKVVQLAIIRGGKAQTVPVTLDAMPTDMKMASAKVEEPKTGSLSSLGLEVTTADDGAGVKITKVDPNSAAAERGLKEGDIILEVAGTQVNDPATIATALKGATGKKVLMLIKTADGQRYLALPHAKG
jgi:serine protease Do